MRRTIADVGVEVVAVQRHFHHAAHGLVQFGAGITEIEVKFTVGAVDEGVRRVVMLFAAGASQENEALVGHAVTDRVAEQEDVRGDGDDDVIAEYGDA